MISSTALLVCCLCVYFVPVKGFDTFKSFAHFLIVKITVCFKASKSLLALRHILTCVIHGELTLSTTACRCLVAGNAATANLNVTECGRPSRYLMVFTIGRRNFVCSSHMSGTRHNLTCRSICSKGHPSTCNAAINSRGFFQSERPPLTSLLPVLRA